MIAGGADEERFFGGLTWHRIALNEGDFDEHGLYELPPKTLDTRYRQFVDQHGERCAEVDALPPNVIRERVREAIMRHIPADQWSQLQEIEQIERRSWESTLGSLRPAFRRLVNEHAPEPRNRQNRVMRHGNITAGGGRSRPSTSAPKRRLTGNGGLTRDRQVIGCERTGRQDRSATLVLFAVQSRGCLSETLTTQATITSGRPIIHV